MTAPVAPVVLGRPSSAAPRRLSPRGYRLMFLGAGLLVTLLVWGIYWASVAAVERSARQSLAARISVDANILEDHATRSLDVVTSVLRAAATLDNPQSLLNPETGTRTLENLVVDVATIRSISLIDDRAQVVASSSARNLGLTLRAEDLPSINLPIQSDEIKFGELFALRDLHELNSDRTPVDLGFWTAFKKVRIGDRDYRWLVAINLGVFQNLWSEVDSDIATTIQLIDEQGRRIVDHHTSAPADTESAIRAVLDRLPDTRYGSLELDDGRLQVAFQGSPAYPAALLVIGNPVLLPSPMAGSGKFFVAVALTANLSLLGLLLLLFLFYRRYETRSQELFNQSRAIDMHLMVSELDSAGVVLNGNDAFFDFNGYRRDELIGQSYMTLSTAGHAPEVRDAAWALLRAGRPWTGVLRNRKKSGELYWVNVTIVPFLNVWGKPERLVTLMTDITESVALTEAVAREKHLREELSRINATLASDANSDPLTGQPNKRAFDLFAEEARTVSADSGKALSLLMIDIDHFKAINDSRGHAVGDAVLKTLAQRWARELRSSDMLARIGGEEFCVVLPRTSQDQARRIAEKLRAVTAAVPVDLDPDNETDENVPVTISVGIATAAHPASMPLETLREQADAALYAAKHQGRNQVVIAATSGTEAGEDAS